jgi:3-oxoacyl-(acyl-carrier-protein) synthase
MRRIVATGLGAVTPLGAGVEASWSRLLAGRSGIRRLPDDVVGDLPASPPPVLGADTENLLAELGFSQRDVDELAREGAI